jgi:hypothetical protein
VTLKQRVPFLRWSFWRLAIGARNFTKTGQIGDGREAAAADYVVANARQGDIDDVIAMVDADARCRAGVGIPRRLTAPWRSASPFAWTVWPCSR